MQIEPLELYGPMLDMIMPIEAKPLFIGKVYEQSETLAIFFEMDRAGPQARRKFLVVGNYQPIPQGSRYIGSGTMFGQQQHVYEVPV